MSTTVSKQRAIAGLRDVWVRLDELLAGLADDDWSRPTPLPGWDVQAVVAHIIGTEAMLLGEPSPEGPIERPTHVRNDIGAFNEGWVDVMADDAPADVLSRFRDHVARRLEALEQLDDATWNADGFTPAGTDTYGRFMRIRTFDCWLHEQDIRDGVGRPGGDGGPGAELALDEMAVAMGYVVGKKAGAPAGARVRFDLTGPAARYIHVEVGERAAVVDELSAAPTVTMTMPVGIFARLAGGRGDTGPLIEQVTVGGDTELGDRIVQHLAYTI